MTFKLFNYCYLLLLFTSLSQACIWDSDTLKMEAEGLPSVVDTIAGHFKTYPKSYYQFRIDRLKDKKNKSAYEFDDLAVAYDRIGDSKMAIEIIESKQRLDLAKFSDKESKDIKYRTLANLGTFQAHLWFRQLKAQKVDSLLDKSIASLAKAIELNPDAHFGREKVQLDFIKWMKSKPAMERERDLQGIVEREHFDNSKHQSLRKTLLGLQGLVVLGEAWQSPDVYISIGILLANMDNNVLSYLSYLRAVELLYEGKNIIPSYEFPKKRLIDHLQSSMRIYPEDQGNIREQFKNLRESGNTFQQAVDTYITKRVLAGDHPDINPKFWSELKLPKKYEIYEPWITREMKQNWPFLSIVFLIILVLLYFKNLDRLEYNESLKE